MDQVLDFLLTLSPVVGTVFAVIGGLAVVGTAVDAAIPDEKDGGFMKKLLEKPIIGDLLKALKRFSPFNVKDKK